MMFQFIAKVADISKTYSARLWRLNAAMSQGDPGTVLDGAALVKVIIYKVGSL
jgi:hypothetical protein